MKRILVILSLVLIHMEAHALDISPHDGPKPIAVLIQTDPWLMVIGSDTPRVAMYDDGQLIYVKKDQDKRQAFFHRSLSVDELVAIKKKISSFSEYAKMKRSYDLPSAITDQPDTKIYLDLDGRTFAASVYGHRMPGATLPGRTSSKGKQETESLPKAIRDLITYLTSLDFADAKPWEPLYVEVMIWGYDYAPNESIHWPKEWPGLESPRTLKRGDSYSIFLPGEELPRLRAFLKTQKERGAVAIDGRKWAVSFRYTFPSEPVWLKAFRGDPKEQKTNKTNLRSDE